MLKSVYTVKAIWIFIFTCICCNSYAANKVYGTIDVNIAQYDAGEVNKLPKQTLNYGRSKIGFMDNHQLIGTSEFFYKIEWGTQLVSDNARTDTLLDNDTDSNTLEINSRLAYVGIRGAYGTIYAGRVYSPFYTVVAKSDIEVVGTGALAVEKVAVKRVSNTLVYKTPETGGLEVYVALATSAENTDDSNLDEENKINSQTYAITYRYNNFTLGIATFEDNGIQKHTPSASGFIDSDEHLAQGVSLQYDVTADFSIYYNQITNRLYKDSQDEDGEKRDITYNGHDIAFKVNLNYESYISLIIGQLDAGKYNYEGVYKIQPNAQDEQSSVNLTYAYQLGRDTMMYLAYENITTNNALNATQPESTAHNIYLGISKQF